MAEPCQMCMDLRVRLMTLRADVQSTAVLLETELEEPTMSRPKLLRVIQARLSGIVDNALGA